MKYLADNKELPNTHWFYVFIRFLVWLIGKIYFRLSSSGQEFIPKEGAVILATSHRSFVDPPMVAGMCKRQIYFMARHDLFNIPILGPIIRRLHAYPVHRGEFDRHALKLTFDILKESKVVMIFPEGTRTKDGKLQPAFAGVGLIVHKAKVPVIPCYLEGSYETFPRQVKFPKPGKITVRYGPVINFSKYYSQSGSKEIYQSIATEIMADIAKLIPSQIQ